MGDWQQLIVLSIVALAAAYLIRRTYRRWFGRPVASCSDCSGCDAVRALRPPRRNWLPWSRSADRRLQDQSQCSRIEPLSPSDPSRQQGER